MRGKVRGGLKGRAGCGITPAHAGKSWGSRSCSGASWDHPRACGEKLMQAGCLNHCEGSPPRMRGKALHLNSYLIRQRITPAHAGKSRPLCRAATLPEDHPRACGEKGLFAQRSADSAGSPPRMRGKVRDFFSDNWQTRITPAHAGKSSIESPSHSGSRDHPRACGEKKLCLCLAGRFRGSPPRMRGKVDKNCLDVAQARITPAHAGKRP